MKGRQKGYRKGRITRERILEEATRLFAQQGYATTTTREIAENVGIAPSVMYNQFSSKEEILYEIIKSASEKVIAILDEVNRESLNPVQCLSEMVKRMLLMFDDKQTKREITIFVDEWSRLSPEQREQCARKHRLIYETFKEVVHKIKAENNGPKVSDTVATFCVLGAMLWVYHWYKESGPQPLQEIAEQVPTQILEGLRHVS